MMPSCGSRFSRVVLPTLRCAPAPPRADSTGLGLDLSGVTTKYHARPAAKKKKPNGLPWLLPAAMVGGGVLLVAAIAAFMPHASQEDAQSAAKPPVEKPIKVKSEHVKKSSADTPLDRQVAKKAAADTRSSEESSLSPGPAKEPASQTVAAVSKLPTASGPEETNESPASPKAEMLPAAPADSQAKAKPPAPAVAPFDETKAKEHQQAWANYLRVPVELTNSIGMKLVLIPPGEFMMGSPDWDKNAGGDEKPQHRVRITKPFYLGKYLVTQEQWQSVMGSNPSHFRGPKNPVEMVSWDDCQQFFDKLNAKSALGGYKFQLPTEAQWEYACRAGSTTKYCFGDAEGQLGDYGWYSANSGNKTYSVGEKKPNAWGLYDMHGNVMQWCADWYAGGYYANSPTDDPTGPATGSHRVRRDGYWRNPAGLCRSAFRSDHEPGYRSGALGFRASQVLADTRPQPTAGPEPVSNPNPVPKPETGTPVTTRAPTAEIPQQDNAESLSKAEEQLEQPETHIATKPPAKRSPEYLPGLVAQFYNDAAYKIKAKARIDRNIDYDWIRKAPDREVNARPYSVLWYGYLKVSEAGRYIIHAHGHYDSQVKINNTLIIANPKKGTAASDQAGEITLTAGYHTLMVAFVYTVGPSRIHLFWQLRAQV